METNPEAVAWLEAIPHPDHNDTGEGWRERRRYFEDAGLPEWRLISHHDLIEEYDLGIGATGTVGDAPAESNPYDHEQSSTVPWFVDSGSAWGYYAQQDWGWWEELGMTYEGPISDDAHGPSYSTEYGTRHQITEPLHGTEGRNICPCVGARRSRISGQNDRRNLSATYRCPGHRTVTVTPSGRGGTDIRLVGDGFLWTPFVDDRRYWAVFLSRGDGHTREVREGDHVVRYCA